MNIILLILGVFLILISIILITINSSNSNTNEKTSVYEANQPFKAEEEQGFKTIDKEIKKDERDNLDISEVSIDVENEETENDILFEKLVKETSLKEDIKTKNNEENNITDQILKMHEEGLKTNEIAKRLKKGVREIEIILKVNKVKD